jgi:predicted secreted protein
MQPAIRAQCGHIFEASLPEIPASGHVWEVSETPEGLTLLDQGYGNEMPEDIGVPRQRRFRFRAGERPGEYTVRFQLRRPWETAAVREETVAVLLVQG